MLTSNVFRHAKPSINAINVFVRQVTVAVQTQTFTDRLAMAPINRGLFDVIDSSGILLNRAEGFEPDYWFEDGYLVTRYAGTYTLRVFDNIMPFDSCEIKVGNRMVPSNGGAFSVKIPFWPQIVSQSNNGLARVSNDGKHIAYASQGYVGQDTFSYRMVNAYGQVSEPECINVTAVR